MLDFRFYLITDRKRTRGRALIAALHAAAQAGVRGIQLREKDLSPREQFALAEEARNLLQPLGTRLLINDRADIACAAKLDGVHLPSAGLTPAHTRICLGAGRLIGASTHTLAEARFAEQSGADFITFGPVFPTPSKLAYGDPVGLEELQRVCLAIRIPVFALGGVTPNNTPACLATGAHGVAAIGAVLEAENILGAVRAFKEALGSL